VPHELTKVAVGPAPLDRYRPLLDGDLWKELERAIGEVAAAAKGRTIWNVNSTAHGGGVAELLAALLPYERGAGIDARWVVIEGSPSFFDVTKRLHKQLHGVVADGSEVTDRDRELYEGTLAENAEALLQLVRPKDVVILHDPQVAGLAPALASHGCRVVWRCHIGVDESNDTARAAWAFLRPYLSAADALVFSRQAYVWDGLDAERVSVIAPSIDAFTPKNQEMDAEMVAATLRASGLIRAAGDGRAASFLRPDGSTGRVTRTAQMLEESSLPAEAPVVVQVSRWDPLKDPVGVMEAFSRYVTPESRDGHLLLAGPAVAEVTDDPEQPRVMRQLEESWHRLEPNVRERVHIARIPMDDEEENAAVVNAIQRHAHVVVQKSIAEGFGLTVAEAMWKGRPMVASRVGGIQDQIEHGKSGLLVDDPRDLGGFGRAVVELLTEAAEAERLGGEGRRRVARQFLAPRQLLEQARLVLRLIT
jgi:trehalose synthase